MKFQTAYSTIDETTLRRPIRTENTEPSKTKQSFLKELDVNNIIKSYQKTGILKKANDFEALYGEFDEFDLRESIDKVHKAKELFLEIPAKIRAQFDHDAGAFIDYATNPDNQEQMVTWGLATKRPVYQQPEPPAPPKDQPEPEVV